MRRTTAVPLAARPRAHQNAISISWGAFILTVICACVLAAGFFLAARQHFNTMDFGMKNSRLRKQVENLQAEKRRLTLAREVSLSPAEIRKAVKALGFRESSPEVAAAVAVPASLKETKTTPAKTSLATASMPPVAESAKPIKASFKEQSPKSIASNDSVKKIVMQRERKTENVNLMAALR